MGTSRCFNGTSISFNKTGLHVHLIKKRDTDLASLGDVARNLKKHRAGSVDNILEAVEELGDDDDQVLTAESTASESESEDVNKVSKMQKIFAKKSIKREKRKEKDHRKKVEKNLISMDDFLSKQSEFKMWLYEEKSKNPRDMSSPKLKSFFKQFVHSWNKRKLPSKFYKSNPSSEASPLTQRKHNFMLGETNSAEVIHCDPDQVEDDRENPSSPFVTFGKTPPKVFKSKRLQLFGGKPDIALLSVAPIGSPKLSSKTDKENLQAVDEPNPYQIPAKLAGPATPYRVSVFPWAVADDSGNQNLDVCSTSTPPNTSFGVQETEDWPTPPTEEEINGSSSDSKPSRTRTNVSPQVPPPPPPPPRSESLTPRNKSLMSPLVPDHYADPYDKLSSTSELAKKIVSDYQEPVNEVIRINTRTQPDNPRLVLRSFSQNEEPDTSLYCKPINKEDICKPATGSEMDGSGTSDSLEGIKSQELYSLPNKPFNPRSSDIEELYSKPVKKRFKQNDDSKAAFTSQSDNQPGNHGNPVTLKKTKTQQSFGLSECNRVQNDNSAVKVSDKVQGNESDVSGHEGIPLGEETESELYSEIMQHFRQKGIVQGEVQKCKPEPIYESIDDCIEKLNSGDEISTEKVSANNAIHEKTESKIQTDEGSGLSRGKKKTVLAASSDKIYETYLSLRGNPNFLKAKEAKGNNMSVLGNTLSKKFKSQPDISFSENCEKSIKVYDNIESHCEELAASNPAINSVNKYAKISNYSGDVNNYVHLTVAQRTQSLENGFKSLECPGTPTITATPSFDSLCTVTPLSKRSESSQSLPAHTGSQENLSYHESNMSVSSRSTLSTVPDEDESRLSETFEDDYATPTAAPPCPTSSFGSADTCPATAGQVSAKPKLIGDDTRQNNTKLDDHAIKEKFANGNIPITPGKISAAKHGIDLSVYILKPVKLDEAGSTVDGQHSSGCSIDSYREAALDSDAKISYETASANKVFEPQTRLAIKENISGSKTKSEIFKSGKKEQERRHTVQTVNEIKVNDQKATQKTGLHASVPSIGLASKVLKAEHNTKPGKSKLKQNFRNENELAFEPDSKRFCVGGTKVMGHGEDLYLETDIDSVIADRGRKNMTKSKSHSSVEHGSSTVVTEIW